VFIFILAVKEWVAIEVNVAIITLPVVKELSQTHNQFKYMHVPLIHKQTRDRINF